MMGSAIAQMALRLSTSGNKDCNRAMVLFNISLGEQESFAGCRKPDVRPAFFGQLQVHLLGNASCEWPYLWHLLFNGCFASLDHGFDPT